MNQKWIFMACGCLALTLFSVSNGEAQEKNLVGPAANSVSSVVPYPPLPCRICNPDLLELKFEVKPRELKRTDPITVYFSLSNQSNVQDHVNVVYKIKRGKYDIELASASFPLDGGETVERTLTHSLPRFLRPGVYGLGVIVKSTNGGCETKWVRIKILPDDRCPIILDEAELQFIDAAEIE